MAAVHPSAVEFKHWLNSALEKTKSDNKDSDIGIEYQMKDLKRIIPESTLRAMVKSSADEDRISIKRGRLNWPSMDRGEGRSLRGAVSD
jgi:hypothetical protein